MDIDRWKENPFRWDNANESVGLFQTLTENAITMDYGLLFTTGEGLSRLV